MVVLDVLGYQFTKSSDALEDVAFYAKPVATKHSKQSLSLRLKFCPRRGRRTQVWAKDNILVAAGSIPILAPILGQTCRLTLSWINAKPEIGRLPRRDDRALSNEPHGSPHTPLVYVVVE
jgi:hypothetical protein